MPNREGKRQHRFGIVGLENLDLERAATSDSEDKWRTVELAAHNESDKWIWVNHVLRGKPSIIQFAQMDACRLNEKWKTQSVVVKHRDFAECHLRIPPNPRHPVAATRGADFSIKS